MPRISLPAIPQHAGNCFHWGSLHGSADALVIAEVALQHQGLSIVIAENTQTAWQLEANIRFFLGKSTLPILHFPDWETLPYDVFSPHQSIISARLHTLYHLPKLKQGLLVIPGITLLQRLCSVDFLTQQALVANVGDKLNLYQLQRQLEHAGYHRVSQVQEHGEFAIRGSLIDLYPMGQTHPYRFDLLDDEIDTIRRFDPESQCSLDHHQHIRLLPAKEFPFNKEAIEQFRISWRQRFPGDPQNTIIYQDISQGIASSGIEYYLPLFFKETASLFDYLPQHTLVIDTSNPQKTLGDFWTQLESRYEQHRHNLERPLLRPDELYLSTEQVIKQLASYPRIQLHHSPIDTTTLRQPVHHFDSSPPGRYPLKPKEPQPCQALQSYLANNDKKILFIAESAGRREHLSELLHSIDIYPKPVQDWQTLLTQTDRYSIGIAPLVYGLSLPDWEIITESQLFGERAAQRRRRQSHTTRDAETIIHSLTNLNLGTPVVHEHSGIGRYRGLQTLSIGDIEQEFLMLEYANNDKLYVPVSDLHLVTRFTGADPESAPLHHLGSDKWQKQKTKAAKQVRDVAAELLAIHAQRAAKQGQCFKLSRDDYEVFSAGFPFEETADQGDAIEAVLTDMQSKQPMDRVICGDVGFGKTEVAMRATFVAISNHCQVSILVPTTLLAQQHLQNFEDRFADWPVRIECLSRFGNQKQQQQAVKDLADGKIDIVIGTHKLLQPSIRFKNLGLIIVDEEQRFGVRHKEQIKRLRAEVDMLTLTATPIPRTLNMAMSGLRDLSIIATPPQQRTGVKTFVSEWQENVIKEACQRELARGGQVYFVHNKVENINKIAQQLSELLPEARSGIAHGQMSERELEQAMLDFYHQRINLLICTTIIESGIDVPTANTIIINRADRFGLAQLHQLRGRVGRSHHRAYAYLITPPEKAMTADAIKRIDAIASLEELGIGFTLATHDLEIRGAGELLGQAQSGQIQEIGYTLYTELLERAVNSLKRGETFNIDDTQATGAHIDLGISALLPSDYVPDVHTRLILYKRIANSHNEDELRELQIELIDRFGLLPNATQNLLQITRIKQTAKQLGIDNISASETGGYIEFNSNTRISPIKLVNMVQQHPVLYKFSGAQRLRFNHELETAEARLNFIDQLLTELGQKEPLSA